MRTLSLLVLALLACGGDPASPPVGDRTVCLTRLDYADRGTNFTTQSVPDSLYGALCAAFVKASVTFADRGEGLYVYATGTNQGQPVEGWIPAWPPNLAITATVEIAGDTVRLSGWTAQTWLARQTFVWRNGALVGEETYASADSSVVYHIRTRWEP